MSRNTRTVTVALAVVAVGALAASALVRPPLKEAAAAGQEPEAKKPAASGQEKAREGTEAIRKAAADYLEAMNKGDREAVLAFWAPDADYVDESGKTTKGRDAIAALFKESLPRPKGSKVTGRSNSLKFLRPEVAVEDGVLEYTDPDGTKESNRFVVVWVKSGDRWLISSARDLPAEAADLPSLTYPRLQPLEWLVGEWEDTGGKLGVKLACRWGPNKSFLLMDYTVKREGGEPLTVTQRVGWDGFNGMVRSWVFDAEGGFAEGRWQRDGNRWVVGTAGVLPDGGRGGSTDVWQFVDDNTFTWRSVDREVDGQPVADVEVKFARKGASK
jgi:uncharacterized protein (TIGR02246 family)